MKFIKNIIKNEETRAKREALYQLSSMSDRMLIDCNISRELLNKGIKAWPWQATPDSVEPIQLQQLDALFPSHVKTPLAVTESSNVQGTFTEQASASQPIVNSATAQASELEQKPSEQRSAA